MTTDPIIENQSSDPVVVIDVCPKCSAEHDPRLCSGHKRLADPPRQCLHHPINGLDVCYSHGGNAPRARAAGARRTSEAAVSKAAGIYGVPRIVDPATGLIEEFWRTAGIISRLEPVVAKLTREELSFAVVEQSETANIPEWSNDADEDGSKRDRALTASERKTVQRAAPSIWVRILNEERDRFARLGLEIMKLGLEQRRDEYVREQAGVFTELLAQLNLTDEQRRHAVGLLRALDRQVNQA